LQECAEMKQDLATRTFLTALIGFLTLYGMGSFIELDFNPANWDAVLRGLISCIWGFVTFMTWLINL
jgi:hypothetical protein